MKRYITSILLAFTYLLPMMGMPYDEARKQALYLSDKMAYELNLNDQQYNDCYEINLDYFLSVRTPDEAYGPLLTYRNADLRHILLDWQYGIFVAADYFLHPLAWVRGAWHFPIYRHYAANYFYYSRPHAYWNYRGGHGRVHFTAGFYADRRPHWTGGLRGNERGGIAMHVQPGHHGSQHDYHGSQPGHHATQPSHGGNRSGHGFQGNAHGDHGNGGYQHPSSTRITGSQSPAPPSASAVTGRTSASAHGFTVPRSTSSSRGSDSRSSFSRGGGLAGSGASGRATAGSSRGSGGGRGGGRGR